jgi:branched-chain amino acid transport system ATP-binding protein
VEENLVATAANRLARRNAWTLADVFSLFPRLKERRTHMGRTLSYDLGFDAVAMHGS